MIVGRGDWVALPGPESAIHEEAQDSNTKKPEDKFKRRKVVDKENSKKRLKADI